MTILADIWLPYPPSNNAIWEPVIARGGRGRGKATLVKTKAGKDYHASIAHAVLVARMAGKLPRDALPGLLSARVIAQPSAPARRRDNHNLLKALFDALEYAGVVTDDSQITDTRIRWGLACTSPRVRVVFAPAVRSSDDDWLYGSPVAPLSAA